ncbi:MAG TPA: zinc-binding alcohol dehydrogenase [Anaerolineaceae bacterium]
MSIQLVLNAPRVLSFEETEDQPLKAGEVRVRTLFSGISAGTELTFYRGSNVYIHKRWDEARRLFIPGTGSSLEYPIRNLGYEEVGEVIETGVDARDIPLGTRIYGTWNHRTTAILPADIARQRQMPEGAEPITGIFSHIGAVALNGVHDAQIRLGDIVAIFGMGALGQIVLQAAMRSGGKVIAIDLHESRLQAARTHGAWKTLNARTEKVAEAIKDLTGGMGADVCIEVSGAVPALNEAIRSAAYNSRVIAMGFFQGDAAGLILGDEFHHNRINLVCSQISGVAPDLQHRWNKPRLWRSVIQMQKDGWLDLKSLVTHTAPFEQAASLFQALDQAPEQVMQAVIQF